MLWFLWSADLPRVVRPSCIELRIGSLKRGARSFRHWSGLLTSLLIVGCGSSPRDPIDLEDETTEIELEPIATPESEEPDSNVVARRSATALDAADANPIPITAEAQSANAQRIPATEVSGEGSVSRVEEIIRLDEQGNSLSLHEYRDALLAPNPELRSAALDALAGDGSVAAMDVLDAEFSGLDRRTQLLILDTYAQVGSNYAIELLRQRLADPDDQIRDAAADYLDEIEELSGRAR